LLGKARLAVFVREFLTQRCQRFWELDTDSHVGCRLSGHELRANRQYSSPSREIGILGSVGGPVPTFAAVSSISIQSIDVAFISGGVIGRKLSHRPGNRVSVNCWNS
jgi:hypothetical protein